MARRARIYAQASHTFPPCFAQWEADSMSPPAQSVNQDSSPDFPMIYQPPSRRSNWRARKCSSRTKSRSPTHGGSNIPDSIELNGNGINPRPFDQVYTFLLAEYYKLSLSGSIGKYSRLRCERWVSKHPSAYIQDSTLLLSYWPGSWAITLYTYVEYLLVC